MSDIRKPSRSKDADPDQPPEYAHNNELERLSYLSRLALQPVPPADPDFAHMTPAELSDYDSIQRLQTKQEEIGTAHRTNQILSQHMALISKPAMLPHYFSLEVTSKDGNITSKAVMNPNRIQCGICKEWFFGLEARTRHKYDLPHDCDDCGKCFRSAIQHAQQVSHTRCFVPSCVNEMRYNYGNPPHEIRSHIFMKHKQ